MALPLYCMWAINCMWAIIFQSFLSVWKPTDSTQDRNFLTLMLPFLYSTVG